MSEIENHIVNLYNIFHNKYFDTTVKYSLEAIKTEIINRELQRVNVNDISSPAEKIRNEYFSKHLELSEQDEKSETTKSIVANSPFRIYFNNLFGRLQEGIDKRSLIPETNQLNPYYIPKLFNILTNQLYLIPLWTGIMIYHCQTRFPFSFDKILSRLSNNPVEAWFGHLKNQLLENNIVITSELASILFERIVSKFIEFYMTGRNENLESSIQNLQPLDPSYSGYVHGFIHSEDRESSKEPLCSAINDSDDMSISDDIVDNNVAIETSIEMLDASSMLLGILKEYQLRSLKVYKKLNYYSKTPWCL